MTAIAVELDRKLQTLDPETAALLERLVRDALQRTDKDRTSIADSETLEQVEKQRNAFHWAPNFWEKVRADWGTEPFERPPQGEFEKREEW